MQVFAGLGLRAVSERAGISFPQVIACLSLRGSPGATGERLQAKVGGHRPSAPPPPPLGCYGGGGCSAASPRTWRREINCAVVHHLAPANQPVCHAQLPAGRQQATSSSSQSFHLHGCRAVHNRQRRAGGAGAAHLPPWRRGSGCGVRECGAAHPDHRHLLEAQGGVGYHYQSLLNAAWHVRPY